MKYAIFCLALVFALAQVLSITRLVRRRRYLSDLLTQAVKCGDAELCDEIRSQRVSTRNSIIMTAIFVCLLLVLAVVVITDLL